MLQEIQKSDVGNCLPRRPKSFSKRCKVLDHQLAQPSSEKVSSPSRVAPSPPDHQTRLLQRTTRPPAPTVEQLSRYDSCVSPSWGKCGCETVPTPSFASGSFASLGAPSTDQFNVHMTHLLHHTLHSRFIEDLSLVAMAEHVVCVAFLLERSLLSGEMVAFAADRGALRTRS
jgi:hypothetical protein